MARSDKMSAADSELAHTVHCLTQGNAAFYADSTQFEEHAMATPPYGRRS